MKAFDPGSEIHGYKIHNEISHGVMGTVYRVEKNSEFFAMKVLKTINISTKIRFKKESSAIARFNHLSLVKIIDSNEIEGIPYIIMEHLEGHDLSKSLKAGPISKELLFKVAHSMASALAEIHKFKLIHRDIKPANIFLTNAQIIKLLDFGLAQDTTDSLDSENKNEVIGTLLYSSPEQSRMLKRPVDSRSDLYSLGITLYECACGRAPFESDNIAELMKMHAAVMAEDLLQLDPTISPTLAAIIAKLICKDPDDRYQSAEGLKYDLEHISELDASFHLTKKLNIGLQDNLLGAASDIPLAGRSAELSKILKSWNNARAGRGNMLIIEGEGGSGKSRLTFEVNAQVVQSGGQLIKAKCQKQSRQIPLGPFREALDVFLYKIQNLPEDTKQETLARIKEAGAHSPVTVSELSSEFRKIFGETSKIKSLEEDADRSRYLEDLSTFFINLAKNESGILLHIDDIQWLDQTSLDLLSRIVTHIQDHRILVLLTARNDKENISKLNLIKKSLGEVSLSTVSLGPLTLDDVGEIISSYLGSSRMDVESVHRIAIASNGNPLVISEYIHGLLNAGFLTFTHGEWIIDQEGINQISLSNDVFQLLQSRISSLKVETKKSLALASIIGTVFDLDSIISCSGLSVETCIDTLQEATQNNLISPQKGSSYRFVHDRIIEVLASELSAEELKTVNDRLAKYSDSVPDELKSWHQIARYYRGGNFDQNLEKSYLSNFHAGRLSVLGYAYDHAFELFSFAFDCARKAKASPVELKKIARFLALASSESGNEKKAHEVIDFAITLANDKVELLDFHFVKMRAYFNCGKKEQTWMVFRHTTALAGWVFPDYALSKWIQINWLILVMALRFISGWGLGRISTKNKKRATYEALGSVYYLATYTSRFRKSVVDSILVTLRTLKIAHDTGSVSMMAKAFCQASVLPSSLRFNNISKFFINWAHELIAQIPDSGAKTYVDCMEHFALIYSGDSKAKAKTIEIGENLQFLGPHELGGWAYTFPGHQIQTGEHEESLNSLMEILPTLYRQSDNGILAVHLYFIRQNLVQMGKIADEVAWRNEQIGFLEPDYKDQPLLLPYYSAATLQARLEQGEIGVETDFLIDLFTSVHVTDYHTRYLLAIVAYIRLAQMEKSESKENRRRTRALVKEALRSLFFVAYNPIHRCHWYIIKAGLCRIEGHHAAALRYIKKGNHLAKISNSPLAIFYAARENARIQIARKDHYEASANLALCMGLAEKYNWILRLAEVQKEFGKIGGLIETFVSNTALSSNSMRHSSTRMGSRSSTRVATASEASTRHQKTRVNATRAVTGKNDIAAINAVTVEERAAAALTRVSLASTGSIDPKKNAETVLEEIVKLFGAERAFLFLADESSETGKNPSVVPAQGSSDASRAADAS